MADYRQDTACGKCGHAYTYFSHTGCPNCAQIRKESRKEEFIQEMVRGVQHRGNFTTIEMFANDVESTLTKLAAEIADLKFGK